MIPKKDDHTKCISERNAGNTGVCPWKKVLSPPGEMRFELRELWHYGFTQCLVDWTLFHCR